MHSVTLFWRIMTSHKFAHMNFVSAGSHAIAYTRILYSHNIGLWELHHNAKMCEKNLRMWCNFSGVHAMLKVRSDSYSVFNWRKSHSHVPYTFSYLGLLLDKLCIQTWRPSQNAEMHSLYPSYLRLMGQFSGIYRWSRMAKLHAFKITGDKEYIQDLCIFTKNICLCI